MNVEVAYALENQQFLKTVDVAWGATALDVVRESGVADAFDLVLEALELGVFSRKVAHDYRVEQGDRVEVYRALTVDPMARRRARAKR
jgi:putative ubiquitin-RnfH superfamily antitoxin RatB of RatAB toxin-antitoxin module